MKTTFQYDHYYRYEELSANLSYFAEKYPDLVTLEANMTTAEGRKQYAVTLSSKKTGDPMKKPGWYLDGNIHAGEVTASMTAMYTIDYLLTNYEADRECRYLLDHMTIYVIPRVSPDGAETYLSTPYILRSANRPYLEEKGGIKLKDLDGDGVIRMMRVKSSCGAWKKDPKDPAKMAKRLPSDIEGEFYDIFPEGLYESFDGEENPKTGKNPWGLDFNRNFPYGWLSDARQAGAGAYPLSNPECKAVVDFVLAHDNIGGAAIGHTSGGLLLFPPGTRSASKAAKEDIQAFTEIGRMGEEILGYSCINIFDSFTDDQENYDSGALDDWFYQSEGIPAYTMEFWDIAKKAGVPIDWGKRKEEPMEKKLQRFYAIADWVRKNAPEQFLDWTEFEHPSFGKAELGGFNIKETVQNPPKQMLSEICEQDVRFNIAFAKAMPRLSFSDAESRKLSEELYEVTAVIQNEGYLPTYLTEEAKIVHKNRPVKICLTGADCLTEDSLEVKDLSGYSRTKMGELYGNLTTYAAAEARKKLRFLVKGTPGQKLTLTASHNKAGEASVNVTL